MHVLIATHARADSTGRRCRKRHRPRRGRTTHGTHGHQRPDRCVDVFVGVRGTHTAGRQRLLTFRLRPRRWQPFSSLRPSNLGRHDVAARLSRTRPTAVVTTTGVCFRRSSTTIVSGRRNCETCRRTYTSCGSRWRLVTNTSVCQSAAHTYMPLSRRIVVHQCPRHRSGVNASVPDATTTGVCWRAGAMDVQTGYGTGEDNASPLAPDEGRSGKCVFVESNQMRHPSLHTAPHIHPTRRCPALQACATHCLLACSSCLAHQIHARHITYTHTAMAHHIHTSHTHVTSTKCVQSCAHARARTWFVMHYITLHPLCAMT